MPQVINTNIMSINTQRVLNGSNASMKTAVERLSSGLRINRAKDDAAGLANTQRFTAQIRGLEQAIRNANDGISLLQTAEGALDEVQNALHRMRELAVQAANGTNSAADRGSLNQEYKALAAEIDRISNVTEFNNINLLGQGSVISLQVGWENGTANVIKVSLANISAASAKGAGSATQRTISTTSHARSALSIIDKVIDAISQQRGNFGAIQNRLESSVRSMANVVENQSAARSRVLDADFAKETASLTRAQILQQAGTAMLAQANQLPQTVLQLLQG
jgi:flagellin